MTAANPSAVYECFMNNRGGNRLLVESPAIEAGHDEAPAESDTSVRDLDTPPETTLETVSQPYSVREQAISLFSSPRQTSSFRRRLPRFHRAKRSHRPPLALQERDIELLRTVHDFKLISTPQLLQLFSDESCDGIYRRLQRLFHHGYLDRLGNNPNAPLVYQLGRRGAEVLEVSPRKDVGDRYLAHRLMIGDFRIALATAAKAHGIDLMWRPTKSDLPVRPDGFFTLRLPWLPDGRNRAPFFLEADRSTMTRERFGQKLAAYRAWRLAGGHTAAYGIKSFRVLTVTKSQERATSLGAIAGALADVTAMFWFAPAAYAGAGSSVLDNIWTVAGVAARQSIIP